MDKELIIEKSEKFVKSYLSGVESGHSWWHIQRVLNNARSIYNVERSGDHFVIDMGAILHDIGDRKIDPGSDGPAIVDKFLSKMGLKTAERDKIIHIVRHISFSDSFKANIERTDELNIVQDADRLDAIGAIGIARAFSYGGSKGSDIYIPGNEIAEPGSKEEYIMSQSSTIGHFYEKLLKLKEMMNTHAGRIMALERHEFMERFLEQFYREVGESI